MKPRIFENATKKFKKPQRAKVEEAALRLVRHLLGTLGTNGISDMGDENFKYTYPEVQEGAFSTIVVVVFLCCCVLCALCVVVFLFCC
jgi:hypothetical protein